MLDRSDQEHVARPGVCRTVWGREGQEHFVRQSDCCGSKEELENFVR